MAEDLGERTEEATPRRRSEAREEGHVAKSQDLAGALMLLLVTLALAAAATPMLGRATSLLAQMLDAAQPAALHASDFDQSLRFLGAASLRLAAPILLI